ncbi:hypothetical protein [Vibrio fluminensis]|uniref:hypothetical protein n=1 Tax=Vibrio fluminensis TaxID=2783614 RepID=UPI0018892511|nr:hypothetical protein [Vibrio fluminensis]
MKNEKIQLNKIAVVLVKWCLPISGFIGIITLFYGRANSFDEQLGYVMFYMAIMLELLAFYHFSKPTEKWIAFFGTISGLNTLLLSGYAVRKIINIDGFTSSIFDGYVSFSVTISLLFTVIGLIFLVRYHLCKNVTNVIYVTGPLIIAILSVIWPFVL